jgi:hypothetical protein
VCESFRAAHLGRSESPISDSALRRKAPRRLNATVPLHLYDVNIALGNLVDLVGTQAQAFHAQKG